MTTRGRGSRLNIRLSPPPHTHGEKTSRLRFQPQKCPECKVNHRGARTGKRGARTGDAGGLQGQAREKELRKPE